MSIETLRSFFLWCSVLNYGLLMITVVLFWIAKDFLVKLVRIFVPLSEEKILEMTYNLIGLQKILLFVFFLVPTIALYLIRI